MNHKQLLLFLLIIEFPIFNGHGQISGSHLWELQSCFTLDQNNEDGVTINVTEPGNFSIQYTGEYLSISGNIPTCDCYCSSTIKAFGDTENYTLIMQEENGCDMSKGIHSNKSIYSILPPELFSLESFTNDGKIISDIDFAIYNLNVDIPISGDEIVVYLTLIPFGNFIEHPSLILPSTIRLEGSSTKNQVLVKIKEVISKLTDATSIDHLLKKEFDKISADDKNMLKSEINEEGPWPVKSLDELSEKLFHLKKIYDINKQVDFTSFSLEWNGDTNRFDILRIERDHFKEHMKSPSFKEFILTGIYFIPTC
ncbi:MAG: hypothetical protein ABGX00_07070 [Allomuricauda sp.]